MAVSGGLNASAKWDTSTHNNAGNIGFSSQSGALGLAVLERAEASGLGLSAFMSIGNKADLSGNDFLQYWENDPATGVIALYLESDRMRALDINKTNLDNQIGTVSEERKQGYDKIDIDYVDDYPEGNADDQAALRAEIEERRRVEEALRQSEQHYQVLAELSYWETDYLGKPRAHAFRAQLSFQYSF